MTPDEVTKKVYECTDAAGMKRDQATRVMRRILALEAEADVSALISGMSIA
jgi:hypothetical protein